VTILRGDGSWRDGNRTQTQGFRRNVIPLAETIFRDGRAANARLKKLVAERDLEIEVMKKVAAKKW